MKILIEKTIFNKVPCYQLGLVIISGINNSGKIDFPVKEKTFAQKELQEWNKKTQEVGIDAEKFPSANVNIKNRFDIDGKLPRVNPAVDLCNIFSLETGMPIGLHDLDKDKGDIDVRPGKQGDTFVPLNQVKAETIVDPIVFAIENRVQTRNWTWRIAETSKVDSRSTNVILLINSLTLTEKVFSSLLKTIAQEFVKKFGGKIIAEEILNNNISTFSAITSFKEKRTSRDKIDELLSRGVENIFPSKDELEKVLRSGKKLKLYQGFDPTGIQLHIGHMAGLRKLRQFQDLGHQVIFLIGDGTGQAGDPSGKKRTREKYLNQKQLRENAKDYVMQAGKIVNFTGKNAAQIKYNGDWLNKLTLVDILDIASHFSLQQLEERDMFVERKKAGESINLREFLYPLLQGYDSVAMKVDLEVGGNDQTFNMLVGRSLVKDILKKEKFVLSTPLIADAQGNKIGKTEGNVIALTSPPTQFYALVMTLPDEVIIKCFEVLTDIPLVEVQAMEKSLEQGENPMTLKKRLAFTLTKMLNSEEDATKAQDEFERVVQNKELPTQMQNLKISQQEEISLADFLVNHNLVKSKSEAKRLIDQGGVEINGEKVQDPKQMIMPENNTVLRVGKKTYIKIVIE